MNHHYLLWATGQDKPGIVAGVTKTLFLNCCNLEDSSMMRLGSEFGILLIFTSNKKINSRTAKNMFVPLESRLNLTIGIKKITSAQAKFKPAGHRLFTISVHGSDKPGIVYRVSRFLTKHRFNITDLATHRTTTGRRPGYILFVEGEFLKRGGVRRFLRELKQLQKKLQTKITFHSIVPQSL
jgi:glycine cleavage system transcriptional repressor